MVFMHESYLSRPWQLLRGWEDAGHLSRWSEHRLPKPAFLHIPSLAGIISASSSEQACPQTITLSFRCGTGIWLRGLIRKPKALWVQKECFKYSWKTFSWHVSGLGSAFQVSLSLLPDLLVDGRGRVNRVRSWPACLAGIVRFLADGVKGFWGQSYSNVAKKQDLWRPWRM